MDEKSGTIKIGDYIEAALRRRWLIILPFCLVMIMGIYLAITLPKVYQAKTLILIEPPRVPEDYIRPLITTEIEQKISTISQQIESRSSLEKIIKQFNLFLGPAQENMFMEDKIESLRDRISVEVIRGRHSSADAFAISFKGTEPEKVMHITNALATYFINVNLKQREAQAVGTSDFLEDELKTIRKRLEGLEKKLKDYRQIHMGGLPEQLDANLRNLDRLQMQLSAKQENLQDAKNRLTTLNSQLSQTQTQPQQIIASPSRSAGETETDPLLRLQGMEQDLEELKSKYTDRHPDVIKLKHMIKELQKKIEKEPQKSQDTAGVRRPMSQMDLVIAERRRLQMQQREETRLEIKKIEAESTKLQEQIAYYQKLVEDTPKKEQELLSIKRDYENMQKSYDSLLESQMQARMAVNMEKKQKGEQFHILDQAQLPTKPVEPDMKKLFLVALMAGLGIGGGLVFGLEYFDDSIRRTEGIESEFGISLLATIPKIYHPRDLIWPRINLAFTVFAVIFTITLTAGFGLLVVKGVDETFEAVSRYASVYGVNFFQ